ncbi:Methylated-DNA--protein-cysteine methyltransferase [Erysiphe neolycopersici]|uniref:Methylated-DNA--protein-cysteine methyltransferase n=1 Tax=Erysiphe neolycopersici TaxID=212602 RepID=A0A420HV52_9PEZI|nr:Methylated-DNA--protein-cysteine methyltransferase [Erysiphe neolycopersici]
MNHKTIGSYKLEQDSTENNTRPRNCTLHRSSENIAIHVKKISLSTLTPFQKRVLVALCQVPSGYYTTYKCLATFLSTSPRAVGNVLRLNPFAPLVPCHRVLASNGKLGGFRGSWGRGCRPGLYDNKKKALLSGEGVHFGKDGVVIGSLWSDFRSENSLLVEKRFISIKQNEEQN